MFYSQFILAKKGPLGTIWIAAHLERKLRKNQVTETNIGVSVDSIMFPEVPIALRLSGHLLLGVVRIYSRKVNYLFHDCSEALVKIKQAFHSGAVDLPPEAATAPFHSITLPESFDLDELELLPDREAVVLANSSVDHHVTTREQITLQEPVDDDLYLGNDFGLDERFPEFDGPRFDFEEDVFYLKSQDTQRQEDQEEFEALEEDTIPPKSLDADETQAPELIDLNQLSALPSNQPELDQVAAPSMLDINVIPEPPEEVELDGVHTSPKEPVATEEQLPSTTEASINAAQENILPTRELADGLSAEPEMELADSPLKANDSLPTEPAQDVHPIPTEAAEAAETAAAELNEEQTGAISASIPMEAETVPEIEKLRAVAEPPEVEASIADGFTPQKEPSEETQGVLKDDLKEVEDTPTLVQDVSVVLQTASPVSPRSADGPEEDDLLATILGRRSSLRVAPTPSDLPPSKRQKQGSKPGLKKRKVRVDESNVLHGDLVRQQLADTTDIRRVRRRVPCTAREIWELEKEVLGQQVFDQSLLPGVCESLREMYYRIYGVGEATLPLLDSEGDAEPAFKSTGRKGTRDKHQMDLHETNEALSLAEEAYEDLYLYSSWREDAANANVEIEPASREEPPPAVVERSPTEPQPSHELAPAMELNAQDQEVQVIQADHKMDKEVPEPEVPGESVRPADEILADQVPATPSRETTVAETEVQKEAEAQNKVLDNTEDAFEMPAAEEETEAPMQENAAEPANEKTDRSSEVAQAEKNAVEDEVSRIEEPQTPEEPREPLEFLVDARDADNDAYDEDANDGNAANQAQDNSGWSVRTRAVCQYLRLTFESMEASSRRGGGGKGGGPPKLVLERLLQGKTRQEAARMFFETLVLKTKDYVNVEQAAPFDNIYISARSKLMKAEI